MEPIGSGAVPPGIEADHTVEVVGVLKLSQVELALIAAALDSQGHASCPVERGKQKSNEYGDNTYDDQKSTRVNPRCFRIGSPITRRPFGHATAGSTPQTGTLYRYN